MTPEERVSAALERLALPSTITTFQTSTHTAQGAADSVGCELGQIVKTLFFLADGRATVVLTKNGLEAAPERTRAIWSASRPESGGQRVLHTMDGSTHAVRGQPE